MKAIEQRKRQEAEDAARHWREVAGALKAENAELRRENERLRIWGEVVAQGASTTDRHIYRLQIERDAAQDETAHLIEDLSGAVRQAVKAKSDAVHRLEDETGRLLDDVRHAGGFGARSRELLFGFISAFQHVQKHTPRMDKEAEESAISQVEHGQQSLSFSPTQALGFIQEEAVRTARNDLLRAVVNAARLQNAVMPPDLIKAYILTVVDVESRQSSEPYIQERLEKLFAAFDQAELQAVAGCGPQAAAQRVTAYLYRNSRGASADDRSARRGKKIVENVRVGAIQLERYDYGQAETGE